MSGVPFPKSVNSVIIQGEYSRFFFYPIPYLLGKSAWPLAFFSEVFEDDLCDCWPQLIHDLRVEIRHDRMFYSFISELEDKTGWKQDL